MFRQYIEVIESGSKLSIPPALENFVRIIDIS
jgi:hypothetical protein